MRNKISLLFITLMMSLMLMVPAYASSNPVSINEGPGAQKEESLNAETALASENAAAPVQEAEASDADAEGGVGAKAIAAGIAIGLGALGGTIAMGLATAKASESMARQPEMQGNIRTTLMLGLVFIETAIIYALLVVILIIFVL